MKEAEFTHRQRRFRDAWHHGAIASACALAWAVGSKNPARLL